MTLEDLPLVNASLNFAATVLIVTGLVCIKRGQRRAHGGFMIAALVTSAAFLTCYLIYHFQVGSQGSAGMGPMRPLYLFILIPHVILAIVNLPMIIMTVLPAIRRNFEKHKRWANRTYPIWLYVSVSGVVVYLMRYVWFPPA